MKAQPLPVSKDNHEHHTTHMSIQKPVYLLLLILALSSALSSCAMPGLASEPAGVIANSGAPAQAAPTQPGSLLLVQAPADATATPTPFQPIPPTAIYYPTEGPTPTPTPTLVPTATPMVVVNQEAGNLPEPEGLTHILLLGSDQRDGDFGFRTDSLMLATLNPSNGTVSLTSFPRDLYVWIPGWGQERINTAYSHGGFRTLADTFEYNFGVRPDHYIMINFHTFNRFVDSLGGIDVNARVTFIDRRPGFGTVTIVEGVNHMDGKTALWYARSRKSTNDFSRARRQQEVILAIAEKLISLDAVKRFPEFYEIYSESMTTDMGLTDILPFLPLAAKLTDTSRIHHYFIGAEQVYDWISPGGGMVLLPRQDAIQQVLRRAMKDK
jgi:LCP family protein required for cell wall assembly